MWWPLQFAFVQTLTQIRQLLDERGLTPKHRLGQNFLHDKNQLNKLLDAADVNAGDVVLEVGPGTGTLTGALLERGAEVIACEIDEGMAGIIETQFAEAIGREAASGSLTLIRGDALDKGRRLNPQLIDAIDGRPFKLAANLPYQIASPLISSLLIDHPNCIGQCVTIQKEVADRLTAEPRTKDYGPLSIIVQALAEVLKIGVLSPSCFWPPPEVTSAMVAIASRKSEILEGDGPLASVDLRRDFARFVVDLFTKRRKQIGSILRPPEHFNWPDGVTADMRPEALTVNQHIELWQSVSAIPRK